jgi:hypothetical protein
VTILAAVKTMSDPFNPYHKWLGIRPEDQPPNHYRLLGVEPFEEDREVIESAANQRMSYLQDLAVGPHVEASQRLLNEISAARRCLLNPEQKAAYDQKLRGEMEAKRAQTAGGHAVWIAGAAALGAAALVLSAWLIFAPGDGGSSGGEPEHRALLVLNWPLNERQGAVILINGQSYDLPDTERIEIRLPEGPHELVLGREGYREIRQTRRFRADEPVRLQPHWRPE